MTRVSVLLLLLSALPALADGRRVAFSIYGEGAPDAGGAEMEAGALASACMKGAWDMHALVSDSGKPGTKDVLTQLMQQTLPPEALTVPAISGMPQPKPADVVAAVKKSIEDATAKLTAGDSFWFTVFAHGGSTCQGEDNHDLGSGVKDFAHCNHSFAVRLPGMRKSVEIATTDLLPILKKLKDRQVKVNVDIRSCYGGAALKDFAQAGLCAHAYATPDAKAAGCGGQYSSTMASASLATSLAYQCRGVQQDEFLRPDQSGKLSVARQCFQGSLALVNAQNWSTGESVESVQAKLRDLDQTPNQPSGTDGPFWVIGNMGVLGFNPVAGTTGQDKLDCFADVGEYLGALTGKIEKISESILGKGCGLRSNVTDFIARNKSALQTYFDAYKNLSASLNEQDAVIEQNIPGGKAAIAAYLQTAADKQVERMNALMASKGSPPLSPERARMAKERILSDPFAFVAGVLQGYAPPKPLDPDLKDLVDHFKLDDAKVKAIRDGLARLQAAYPAHKKKFNEVEAQVPAIERRLYDELKDSPEYKACILARPQLAAAKKACADFRY